MHTDEMIAIGQTWLPTTEDYISRCFSRKSKLFSKFDLVAMDEIDEYLHTLPLDKFIEAQTEDKPESDKQVKICCTSRALKLKRKRELVELIQNKSSRIKISSVLGCQDQLYNRFRVLQVDNTIDDEFLCCAHCNELISSPKVRGKTPMRRHATCCNNMANSDKPSGDVTQTKLVMTGFDSTQERCGQNLGDSTVPKTGSLKTKSTKKKAIIQTDSTTPKPTNSSIQTQISVGTQTTPEPTHQTNLALDYVDKDGKIYTHFVSLDNAFVYLYSETGELILLKRVDTIQLDENLRDDAVNLATVFEHAAEVQSTSEGTGPKPETSFAEV